MSAYEIEFKLRSAAGVEDTALSSYHVADNATGTATSSWVEAVAANAYTSPATVLIVANKGATAIGIRNNSDDDRYHVVMPGTQRHLNLDPTQAVDVKTL